MQLSPELCERAASIRLLVLDVDGVLTDGRLTYGSSGEELKTFHVRDGLGLRLVQDAGVEVAVITARGSAALDARMRDLRIARVLSRQHDKLRAFEGLLADTGCLAEHTAYVGDDVIDVPVLRAAGIGIAVQDAHPVARQASQLVTDAMGGQGAVREVCDMLLDCKMGLAQAVQSFLARVAREGPKGSPQ